MTVIKTRTPKEVAYYFYLNVTFLCSLFVWRTL